MKAGTVCSRLMEVSVLTTKEDECRGVGRGEHHWPSLTETWQLIITLITVCV